MMRTAITIFTIAMLFVCDGMRASAVGFEAAAGCVDITPTHSVYIAGYGNNRKSQGVHDPLWARCVVMRNNGETVALVSCDLLGVGRHYIQSIRKLVKTIPPEHILLGVTHTHSGPDTYGQWGPDAMTSGVDKAWIAGFCRQTARLIDETVTKLRPASARFGSVNGVRDCSKNIRVPKILDTELGVMQLVGVDGKAIATVVNYACHPEVLDNRQMTSDFPFWMRKRMEEKFGGVALYFNGAQGGMVTADTRNEASYPKGEAWPEAQRIGNTLADYAITAVQEGTRVVNPKVRISQRIFTVPLESIAFKSLIGAGIYPKDTAPGGILTTEVNRLVVGPAEFLTLPGEVLPNIGFYLKRQMAGQPRFLLGLTGDALGYILTPEDFGLKLYSYESSVSVGARTGRVMEDNLMELMHPDATKAAAPKRARRP